MLISCATCHASFQAPIIAPRKVRCLCGHVWMVTAEDIALANAPVVDPPAQALQTLPDSELDYDGLADLTLGFPPGYRSEPVIINGLIYDHGVVYHAPPEPIIESYRKERSWSYIVRAVDHLVETLTELEDQIGQHAHGIYDWRTDRFADVGNLSDISNEAVAAFVEQFRNLPHDRQTILRPYLTWAISVTKYCADTMEPRIAAARENSWERQNYLEDQRLEARDIALNELMGRSSDDEDVAPRSSGWGKAMLGAVVGYQIGKYRGRRGY